MKISTRLRLRLDAYNHAKNVADTIGDDDANSIASTTYFACLESILSFKPENKADEIEKKKFVDVLQETAEFDESEVDALCRSIGPDEKFDSVVALFVKHRTASYEQMRLDDGQVFDLVECLCNQTTFERPTTVHGAHIQFAVACYYFENTTGQVDDGGRLSAYGTENERAALRCLFSAMDFLKLHDGHTNLPIPADRNSWPGLDKAA